MVKNKKLNNPDKKVNYRDKWVVRNGAIFDTELNSSLTNHDICFMAQKTNSISYFKKIKSLNKNYLKVMKNCYSFELENSQFLSDMEAIFDYETVTDAVTITEKYYKINIQMLYEDILTYPILLHYAVCGLIDGYFMGVGFGDKKIVITWEFRGVFDDSISREYRLKFERSGERIDDLIAVILGTIKEYMVPNMALISVSLHVVD